MSDDWRREYVRLLSSARKEDWERARTLKREHLPQHLFRYYRPDDHARVGLEHGTVWMSDASRFNDLFDTSVEIDGVQGFNAILKKKLAEAPLPLPVDMLEQVLGADDALATLDQLFVQAVEKQNGPDEARKARGFLRKFMTHHAAEMTAKLSQSFQAKTKVVCFCEVGDSTPLWGLYADSHRGFCVEYPLSGLAATDIRLRLMHPVVYTATRFNLTQFAEQLDGQPSPFAAILAAIHKSNKWAEEREWRIVNPIGDSSPGMELLMPKPSRLLLGSRMAPEYRERLGDLARAGDIPVFEMQPSTGFELCATPVKP